MSSLPPDETVDMASDPVPASDRLDALVRREVIQTVVALAAYGVCWLALELSHEDSTVRWRLRRVWHELMVSISGPEENKQIALTAARGIAYAQVWLGRKWNESNRKETSGD